MSLGSRYALARAAAARYTKATKKEKGCILDEFCANTGLSRKHALRMLRDPPESKGRLSRRRPRRYGEAESLALRRLWPLSGYLSSRRLVVALPVLLEACERHGEWVPEEKVRERLLKISASTCDRLLRPMRAAEPRKGLCLTRAGSEFKRDIQVRRGTDWNDAAPGFAEGDLVGHCGGSSQGSFLYTLTVTDVCLGWTEFAALASKHKKQTLKGLRLVHRHMPVPFKGLDFDNGGEFINDLVLGFCRESGIVFTRGRTYVKNDGCHVEQKNGALVRKYVGYERLDTQKQLRSLRELYRVLRLLVNYFEPSAKLVKVQSQGGRTRKTYDRPKTPYQRAMDSPLIPKEDKEKLTSEFLKLNPVALRNQLKLIKKDLLHPGLVRLLDDAKE